MSTSSSQELRSEQDIVRARQLVRKMSQECKFSLVEQTKFVTAASELARNTVTYGGGGNLLLEVVTDGVRTGIKLSFIDEGPGIEDVGLALTDGWTSGSGMGLGLSGAKRLVDDFSLDTTPGVGTKVVITRWK